MAVRLLLNKNQSRERIRQAFIDAGCPDPEFVEVKSREEARLDVFEVHHTTIIEVVPSASISQLMRELEEVSGISDDLNRIGMSEDAILTDSGSARTDVRVIRLAIGKPKQR